MDEINPNHLIVI